jgi:S-ribosylhomocysteine lyase LuxS involved in autoinducer biosynthesis
MIKLSDINEKTLRNYLGKISANVEIEVRFGSFIYQAQNYQRQGQQERERPKFESIVDTEFFFSLKKVLDEKIKEMVKVSTKELAYKNPRSPTGNIREITYTNDNFVPISGKPKVYMNKNKLNTHEIYDYDIRVGVATENIMEKNTIKDINWDTPSFIRYKQRFSYIFDIGQLDLTIVHQGITEAEARQDTRYEIEFEIKENDYEKLLAMMTFVLQIKQKNVNVISKNVATEIYKEYLRLTGAKYFIGAQPETLQKDKLSNLFKELYSVTDKADGNRYFMFINSRGNVYYIDNNIKNILLTDLRTNLKNTIIDGELIENENSINFYAFDIIFYDGKDLRGDKHYLLRERLALVNTTIKSLTQSDYYIVEMKKFIWKNVFIGSEFLMKDIKNKPYKNDGLIFTPMNESYPLSGKWDKLFKWKPAELNTIDFYSLKERELDGSVKWKLYVQNKNQNSQIKNDIKLELFNVKELCNLPDSKDITFETTFDDNLLDPTTGQPYKTKTVIEYKWEKTPTGGKFIPLRTRWDKTANKKKHGNFVHVACNIWNNINNPITPQQLFQMTNSSTQDVGEKPFFFDRLKKFDSKIHEYLINKYIKNETYLLELNTSLDIFKRKSNENFTIFTFNNIIKKTNTTYLNFKLDLNNIKATEIIKQKFIEYSSSPIEKLFDNCIILNSSPFLKSENTFLNFLKILEYNLKINSKVIISFINKDKIKDEVCIRNNEIMYYIQNFNETFYDETWSNPIKLFINGMSNESDMIEYCISEDKLIKYFEKHGYKSIPFNEKPKDVNLMDYEKNIHDIYSYCIFEKCENKINKIIEETNEHTLIMNENTFTQDNLEYFKISTNYDIFNLLNCINDKYTNFKSIYNIKDIISFDELRSIFQNTEFDNKVYFIDSILSFQENKENELNNTVNIKDNGICIYKYKYEEEVKNTENIEENIVYINYYIMLFNNNIVSKISDVLNLKFKKSLSLKIKKEIKEKEEIEDSKEEIKEDNLKVSVKNEIKKLDKKITVIKIKEYLKLFNAKLTGNKQELLKRLNGILDI